MASIFTLFSAVVVACIGFGNAHNEFVWIECKSNTGHFGHPSLLDCVVNTSKEVIDPHILRVTWKKVGEEEPLLRYDSGNISPRNGYRFAESSWNEKNMNVSLLITDTEIQHEGEYICTVNTDSGINTKKIKLGVTATYNKPSIMSDPKNIQQGHTLTCDTKGGYPKGNLRWFVDVETDWTNSAEFQATPGPDGRFQLTSTLKLLSGSTFSTYTCVVFNASGGKEEEVTFDINESSKIHGGPVEVPSDNHSRWVAPVVVIGSLIIGLLLLLLFFRRRSRQLRRPSAAPLMGEHEAVPPYVPDVEKGVNA